MSLRFVRQEGAEALYICPDCGKPKLSWNAARGLGRCLTCGKGYNEVTFGRLLGKELTADVPKVSWRRPTPAVGFAEAWNDPRCRAYLLGRGVDQMQAEMCGVLYADDQVHFAVWSPFGDPPMLMRRSILPGKKGWRSFSASKENYLFGEWPIYGPVVLVEGTFDVMTPNLWGAAVATLGKSVSFDMAMWIASHSEQVFIWYDPDAAGIEGSLHVADLLTSLGSLPRLIHAKEPGSCTFLEAQTILKGYGIIT